MWGCGVGHDWGVIFVIQAWLSLRVRCMHDSLQHIAAALAGVHLVYHCQRNNQEGLEQFMGLMHYEERRGVSLSAAHWFQVCASSHHFCR
jgi:hypothetical protein